MALRRKAVDALNGVLHGGRSRRARSESFDSTASIPNSSGSYLVVTVHEARNLLAKDSNGFSDPYVQIKFNNAKGKTKIIKKCLFPVWEEEFVFKAKCADNEVLTFVVKDKDLVFDDMLGVLEIPLWKIIEKASSQEVEAEPHSVIESSDEDTDSTLEDSSLSPPPTSKRLSSLLSMLPGRKHLHNAEHHERFQTEAEWFPLERASGMKTVTGEIKLSFTYYKAAFGLDKSFSYGNSSHFDGDRFTEALERPELRNFCTRPKLFVQILQARNLPISDINGLSDPFVTVSCRKTAFRTQIRSKTLEPEWNEEFVFGEQRDYLTANDILQIHVYDKDLISKSRTCSLELPLWMFTSSEEPAWFRLHKHPEHIPAPVRLLYHKEETIPEVQLRVAFIDSNCRRSDAYKLYNGKVWYYQLKLRVCSARRLVVPDTSDIYATVRCGMQKNTTSKVSGTHNPIWKEQFLFSTSAMPRSLGLTREDLVNVDIMRKDSSSGKTIAVGSCDLDIGFIADTMGYVDIEGKKLLKTMNLTSDCDTAEQQVRLSMHLKPIAETRLQSYFKVWLKVTRMKNLTGVDRVFVKGTIGTHIFATESILVSSGYAYINHLIVTSSQECNLPIPCVLKVYDYDKQALIGKVGLMLADKVAEWFPLPSDGAVFLQGGVTSVEHELTPTIGLIKLKLKQLKMYTHTFSHKFSVELKYGTLRTRSLSYAHGCNIVFSEDAVVLPVKDVHLPLELVVLDDGVKKGSVLLSTFEIQEHSAKAQFFTNTIQTMKVRVKDSKGNVKGKLECEVMFEDNWKGVFSSNANPSLHPKPSVSMKAVLREMERTNKILHWGSSAMTVYSSIIQWEHTHVSIGCMLCCVIFWGYLSSRWLSLLPIWVTFYVLQKYYERSKGNDIVQNEVTIQQKDTKARLKIAVLRAKELLPMDANGKSDPFVVVSYSTATSKRKSNIGRTSVVAESLNPEWCNSGVGFKVLGDSSLIKWGPAQFSEVVPSFETYLPKSVAKKTFIHTRIYRQRGLPPAKYSVTLATQHNATDETSPACALHPTSQQDTTPHNRAQQLSKRRQVWNEEVTVHDVGSAEGILNCVVSTEDEGVAVFYYGKVSIGEAKEGHKRWIDLLNEEKERVGELEIEIYVRGIPLDTEGSFNTTDAVSLGTESSQLSEDSWINSLTTIHLDVYDSDQLGHDFLGRTNIALPDLIQDPSKRQQEAVTRWVPLNAKFDGGKADDKLWQAASRGVQPPKRSRPRSKRQSFLKIFKRSHKLVEAPSSAPEHMADDNPHPFGYIQYSAQLQLPNAGAEERLSAAEEVRKAEKVGVLEVNKMIKLYQKRLEWLHSALFTFNNKAERIKNLLCWAHPNKTTRVLWGLVALSGLCLVVPTNIIIIAVTLFLMTEHFRPIGVMKLKAMHLLSLVPTDDDLLQVYSANSLMNFQKNNNAITSEDNDQVYSEADSSPNTHSNKRAMGFFKPRPNAIVLDEANVLLASHLRLFKSNRTWRRYYFALTHEEISYWKHKEDIYTIPAYFSFSEITRCEAVQENSEEATTVELQGCEMECSFVVEHEGRSVLLVANSKEKRDKWVRAAQRLLQINS